MELADRIEHLQRCKDNPKLQQIEMELCSKDPVYWFNTYCWTTNSRKAGYDLPFILYPYQEWCIEEWVECLEKQIDIGIEKSRDMGATWLLMLLMQWAFLFRPGWNFHCGSKREDEVCNAAKSPDATLFGKLRFNFDLLPTWMKPPVMDKKLYIQNLANGNMISGESANAAFGRSRRYRAIFMDELAYWDNAEEAYEGCADTTNCRIVASTPYGESNTFHRIMHNKNNDVRPYPDAEKYLIEKGMIGAQVHATLDDTSREV